MVSSLKGRDCTTETPDGGVGSDWIVWGNSFLLNQRGLTLNLYTLHGEVLEDFSGDETGTPRHHLPSVVAESLGCRAEIRVVVTSWFPSFISSDSIKYYTYNKDPSTWGIADVGHMSRGKEEGTSGDTIH